MNKGQDKALDREEDVDFTGENLDIPASNNDETGQGKAIPDAQNAQYNKRGERPERKKEVDHPNSDKKI